MSFKSKIDRRNGHIIQFLSDIDFYKLTMLQFLLHHFPWVNAKYKYKNRTIGIPNVAAFVDQINKELNWLCLLRFRDFELAGIGKDRFMSPDFIQFLRLFKLNRKYIRAWVDEKDELHIEAEGPIVHVMLFEIYVLEIVEEVYTRNVYPDLDYTEGRERLEEKIRKIKEYVALGKLFSYADFGGRRRASGIWHEELIATTSAALPPNVFVGTSNVLLSILYDLRRIGTMAHEIFQMAQALILWVDCQKFILQKWSDEYRGELGIALTDTMGFDKFLKDFDKYFAMLFAGGRHDSGDPFKWGDRFITHYKGFGINPMTKTAVFSDGLTFEKAFRLSDYFLNRILVSHGIGTHFTNDVGIIPMQIVMKIVECMGRPVSKISDSEGKGMCEDKGYDNSLKAEIARDLQNNQENYFHSLY
jgi:nicotinate phosphoribosyltransferase